VEDILHECLAIREIKNNQLDEIKILLRWEYLNTLEREIVIKVVTKSQNRFHILGKKLTATNVLQHQIPTTNDQLINTR